MPAKGSKKSKDTQEGQPEIQDEPAGSREEETPETPKVPSDLAERLARIESVLETLSAKAEADAAPKRRVPSPTIMTTRQKAARTKNSGGKKSTPQQSQSSPSAMEDVQMQEIGPIQPATESTSLQTPVVTSAIAAAHQQNPYVNTTLGSHQQSPYVNTPNVNTPNPSIDFNTWLLNKTPAMNPQFSQQYMPMASKEVHNNSEIDARVQQIIANSTTNLAKGTSPQGLFPFKYVTRGHDKVKTAINSITALEHLWGIFAIIKDPTVQSGIKPALLAHMDQILEDCRWYDWESAVRPWSEEVFSLIAEGRLPLGWDDTQQIQMLRMTISRASTARIYGVKEQFPRGRQYQHQPQATGQTHGAHEMLKGGPPCPQYNSQQGCQLPSGHNFKGKKMIHVCAYCITELSASYPHSVANCRHKARSDSQQHFY